MLVAVLMIFVIFSFTGVAVLNVSAISSATSAETVNNIKMQYALESTVNESLWRMNIGADSLVNVNQEGIITLFDPVMNTLSVKVDKFQMEAEVTLDLSEDTHFDRALASDETIETNDITTDYDEENRERFFTFLPEADMDYFMDNAVEIHTENFHRWDGGGKHEDDEAFQEGIHVFTGSFLEFKKMHLDNVTLVFTGRYIWFNQDNHINAPVPVDSADAMPALVFSNPDNYFEVEAEGKNYDKEDKINGAIYTAGTIILKKGELSGPIVGNTVRLEHGATYGNYIDFKDTEHPHHYRWHKGFKNKKHYDWPKQIGRWKTKKWGKKHHDNKHS